MIETDKLIYIQMQKTGCTRIGEIILELCDGQFVGPRHNTLLSKPDKFVLGSIRNPWEWYVSLWAFGCKGKGGVLGWLKDDADWQRVYSNPNDVSLFRQWLKMVYSAKYVRQMQNGYDKFCLYNPFRIGLMTWRYAYLYLAGIDTDLVPRFDDYRQFTEYEQQHNMVDHFIRLENLYSTLYDGLSLAGYEIYQNDLIPLCFQRSNQSQHLPYQEYYDSDSIELVRNRERLIVKKFGYSFDDE